MTKKEIEDFLTKVEGGLFMAHQEMLREKALHNQCVVLSEEKGKIIRVPAKEVLEKQYCPSC